MNPWKNQRVHRIYTYIEHGLTPNIVNEFYYLAEKIGCQTIIDPFIGGGVVAVEGLTRGFNVIGLDVNPWSLIVTRAKTIIVNESLHNTILSGFRNILDEVSDPYIPSTRLLKYHNEEHLERIGKIRAAIEKVRDYFKPLFLAVLGKIVDEYSLLKRTPAPRFKGSPPNDDPLRKYIDYLEIALNDLSSIRYKGSILLFLVDSSQWLPSKICGLLTSPPFANNIDYIRHTQLQLLWGGFAKDSSDLGYWRDLQIPACEAASRAWKKVVNHRKINALIESMPSKYKKRYKRFLRQYFYYMFRHFDLLVENLEGIAWYTIGDSVLGGVYIPTHRILANYIREKGLKTTIEKIANRWSRGRKLGLYLLKINSRK